MLHNNQTYYSTKKVWKAIKANNLPCSSSHQNVKKKFTQLGIELIEDIPAEWDKHSLGISESDLVQYLNQIKKNALNGERLNVINTFKQLGLIQSDSVKTETQQVKQIVKPIAVKVDNSELDELKKQATELKNINSGLVTELNEVKTRLVTERNDLLNQLELAKRDYETGLVQAKLDLVTEFDSVKSGLVTESNLVQQDLVTELELNQSRLVAESKKVESGLVAELDLVQSRLVELTELNEKLNAKLNEVSKPTSWISLIEWFTYAVHYTFTQLFKLTKTKSFLFAVFCMACIMFAWHGGEYYYSIAGGNKGIGYAMAGVFEVAAFVMTLHGYSKSRLAWFASFSGLILALYLSQFVNEIWKGGIFIYPIALAFAQYSFGDKLAAKSELNEN